MGVNEPGVRRYRAKAARRPVLFWWQAFLLLGVVLLLWSQLPLTAVLFEARVIPPLPEAHAAYVTLDPAYAAQAFKKSLTDWTLSGTGDKLAPGLDIGGMDLGSALQPPEYLEQGARYPGVWQPAAVEPLAQRLPDDLRLPSEGKAPEALRQPELLPGVRTVLAKELEAARFTFPAEADAPPERSGFCRFYLETGADGAVEHVLLLTARSLGASVFERLLLRGHASGAARGFVELTWSFPK
jgi:hypothetical protein